MPTVCGKVYSVCTVPSAPYQYHGRRQLAHLDGVIIQWVHSFDTETDANEYQNRAVAPLHATVPMSPRGVYGRPRCCINIGFVECAVRSHCDPEASVREVMYKGPGGERGNAESARE